MTLLERVRKLNIFSRIAELEARERERDQALELMLLHLEAIQTHLEKRINATDEQTTRLHAVVGYNLDVDNDLDVK